MATSYPKSSNTAGRLVQGTKMDLKAIKLEKMNVYNLPFIRIRYLTPNAVYLF